MKRRYYLAAWRPFNVARVLAWIRLGQLPAGEWFHVGTQDELRTMWQAGPPDRAFFLDWSWRVPDALVSTGKCVGFHCAPLPQFRGGSPIQHQILAGCRETALTAFRMTREMDAGPILAQRALSLEGTTADIWRRIGDLVPGMIAEILSGKTTPKRQRGEGSTFRRRLAVESQLDPWVSLSKLWDLIRMLDCEGYPRAYLALGGRKWQLSEARLSADGSRLCARVEVADPEPEPEE